VYQSEAPWHIAFPQGTVIRGSAGMVGQWPSQVAAQPANFRISTQATSGEGVVLEDNSAEIKGELAKYNATIPDPKSDSGLCSVSAGQTSRGAAPALSALAAVLGSAWLRRRRRG
jgi:hypothetical protein